MVFRGLLTFPGVLARRMPASSAVDARLLSLAYRNLPTMLLVNVAIAFGEALALSLSGLDAWPWFAAVVLLMALRGFGWRRYRAAVDRKGGHRDHSRWRWPYAAGLYASGAMWGVLGWFGDPYGMPETRYTTAVIIAALAGGATGIAAPLRLEGRLYIAILLLPSSAMIAHGGDAVLGALGLVFMAVMMITHGANNRVVRRSTELQIRNAGLVRDLRSLNASLEGKVAERTEALRRAANRDALTGLPNRRALLEWMGEKLDPANPQEAAILFLDLDRFKQVNDAMGHEIGDQVLRRIAVMLAGCLPADAILARWGGDEFVVATRQAADMRAGSDHLAQALLNAAAASLDIAGESFGLGVSIGRAYFPTHARTFPEIIQLADLAVAETKRHGRGRVFDYSEAFSDIQRRRFALSRALGDAIAEGGLTLAYQPIIDAATGSVACAEALARWRHPEFGAVAPSEFIRLAEETDRIIALGAAVLRQACTDAAAWRRQGVASKVAVNVSVRQLRSGDFAAELAEILRATGLDPEALQIEVTESLFDDDGQGTVLSMAKAVRAMGVSLHIDDFGSGYSSLSRLHVFPVNAIKIDRSFVEAVDGSGTVIIRSAIMIARQFGFAVIAEGVETPEQAAILAALGVDGFQGYLFSKPVEDILGDLRVLTRRYEVPAAPALARRL